MQNAKYRDKEVIFNLQQNWFSVKSNQVAFEKKKALKEILYFTENVENCLLWKFVLCFSICFILIFDNITIILKSVYRCMSF